MTRIARIKDRRIGRQESHRLCESCEEHYSGALWRACIFRVSRVFRGLSTKHTKHEKKRGPHAKTQRIRTGASLNSLRLCAFSWDFFVAFALVAACRAGLSALLE